MPREHGRDFTLYNAPKGKGPIKDAQMRDALEREMDMGEPPQTPDRPFNGSEVVPAKEVDLRDVTTPCDPPRDPNTPNKNRYFK